MIPYSSENNGFKYILTVIYIFKKISYATALKAKDSSSVVEAMKTVFKKSRYPPPHNIHSDMGKEFLNKRFHDLMMKHNINHYYTFSKLKASIVERFNRTLKNKIWPKFSLEGSCDWISILDNNIKEYNNTKHRTIKMKPVDVNFKNEKMLLKTVDMRSKSQPETLSQEILIFHHNLCFQMKHERKQVHLSCSAKSKLNET